MCPYTRVGYTCGHCRYTVRAWCENYERTHIRCHVRVVALERRYVIIWFSSYSCGLRFSTSTSSCWSAVLTSILPPLFNNPHFFQHIIASFHSAPPSTRKGSLADSISRRFACGDCQPSAYAPWMEALKLSLPTQRRLNKAWRRKPPRPVWAASCS